MKRQGHAKPRPAPASQPSPKREHPAFQPAASPLQTLPHRERAPEMNKDITSKVGNQAQPKPRPSTAETARQAPVVRPPHKPPSAPPPKKGN